MRDPLPEAGAQTSVQEKEVVAMRKLLLPTDGSASSLRTAGFLLRFLAGQPAADVPVTLVK